jgi:hypothetical protein
MRDLMPFQVWRGVLPALLHGCSFSISLSCVADVGAVAQGVDRI